MRGADLSANRLSSLVVLHLLLEGGLEEAADERRGDGLDVYLWLRGLAAHALPLGPGLAPPGRHLLHPGHARHVRDVPDTRHPGDAPVLLLLTGSLPASHLEEE